MRLILVAALTLQIGALGALMHRLRRSALGKLGFLLMLSTFLYHGFTEAVQFLFPGRNTYRSAVSPDALEIWLLLISGCMVLFTMAYLAKLKKISRPPERIPQLLRNLAGAYLLKWPVLLGTGLAGMVIVIAEKSGQAASYITSGLADQFTGLLLAVALATASITTARRWHVAMFAFFAVITTASGARGQVMITVMVALSAMVRYGFRISLKTILSLGVIILVSFVAISVSRGSYGRFQDEGFFDRLKIIASSLGGSGDGAGAVLEDSVYRSDGNSFAAMILERQLQGYGSTGFTQLLTTVAYCVPSFIYRSKLDLDTSLRNEENYQDQFYDFPEEIDYISDFWSLLLGYAGIIGIVILVPLLGWLFAIIDNWLLRDVSASAYICGIGISLIPVTLEMGIAGIPYTLRGLVAFVVVNKILSLRRYRKAQRTLHARAA